MRRQLTRSTLWMASASHLCFFIHAGAVERSYGPLAAPLRDEEHRRLPLLLCDQSGIERRSFGTPGQCRRHAEAKAMVGVVIALLLLE